MLKTLTDDYPDFSLLNSPSRLEEKTLGTLVGDSASSLSQRKCQYSYGHRAIVARSTSTMNTKFLATVSIVGVALLCVNQAQSQPPPTSVATGRTSEQVTRPQASGGGHGQVWVNTELGVYHREGSPFYGTTAKGKYMTQQDAIRAGYKPAPKSR
jgi:hypothetical protein